jgi:hypothetical protein
MRATAVIVILGACGFNRGEAAIDGPPGTGDDASGGGDGPVSDGPPGPDAPVGEPDAPPPPPDATVDANTTVFDPSLCPAGYSQWSGSPNGSQYRLIATGGSFSAQNADCADDHAGWTHIVVLDSTGEAALMKSSLTGGYILVGVVQAPSQATPGAGWFELTGDAMVPTMWGGGQPNDGGDDVENNEQNVGAMQVDVTDLINDVEASFQVGTVCECDGRPVDPTVATYIP